MMSTKAEIAGGVLIGASILATVILTAYHLAHGLASAIVLLVFFAGCGLASLD